MAVVVVGLLAVGTLGGAPPTAAERARNLEETIRCPSCASQSVANSDTPSAEGVKVLIRERIAAGDSDEEIRDYIASRYPSGRQLLLDPAGKGFGALVWGVPVAFAIAAVAALVVRFRDWRPRDVPVTAADRELVAAALATAPAAAPSDDALPDDALPDDALPDDALPNDALPNVGLPDDGGPGGPEADR
jgi:cytochrome c-type biogenesis protein CcmH